MYTVYIFFSPLRNRYYIGFTGDDVHERLKKHNTAHSGFTGKILDWEVAYTEKYSKKNLPRGINGRLQIDTQTNIGG